MKPNKKRDLKAILILLFSLAVIPFWIGNSHYMMSVLMNCAGLSIIASGVWLTFSIGRINIGQSGFVLIGAYATAILLSRANLSYWLVLPLSALFAGVIGLVIGSAILKLKGIYFSMLTICLAESIHLAFLNGGSFTLGSMGITDLPQPFQTDSAWPMYYLVVALLALAILVTWRMHYSRLGGIFRAMRLNEDLAESFGVDVWRYRIVAYAIACSLGGIGGSYLTVLTQSVYPQSFTINDSVYYMLFCFLGGLGFVSSAMVGAFTLTILFVLLQSFQQYQSLIYGIIMIAVMLVMPNGLMALRLPSFGKERRLPSFGKERRLPSFGKENAK